MSLAATSPGCATNESRRLLCRIGVIAALLRLASEAASSVISINSQRNKCDATLKIHRELMLHMRGCVCVHTAAHECAALGIHKFGTQKQPLCRNG